MNVTRLLFINPIAIVSIKMTDAKLNITKLELFTCWKVFRLGLTKKFRLPLNLSADT